LKFIRNRINGTRISATRGCSSLNSSRSTGSSTTSGTPAANIATWLGLDAQTRGLVSWDVFEAVLTPGTVILLSTWRDDAAAESFEQRIGTPDAARLRRVRIIRDYGMFDRREAPQYYPAVEPRL